MPRINELSQYLVRKYHDRAWQQRDRAQHLHGINTALSKTTKVDKDKEILDRDAKANSFTIKKRNKGLASARKRVFTNIHELSQDLLKRYKQQAGRSYYFHNGMGDELMDRGDFKRAALRYKKADKRDKGITMAKKKLGEAKMDRAELEKLMAGHKVKKIAPGTKALGHLTDKKWHRILTEPGKVKSKEHAHAVANKEHIRNEENEMNESVLSIVNLIRKKQYNEMKEILEGVLYDIANAKLDEAKAGLAYEFFLPEGKSFKYDDEEGGHDYKFKTLKKKQVQKSNVKSHSQKDKNDPDDNVNEQERKKNLDENRNRIFYRRPTNENEQYIQEVTKNLLLRYVTHAVPNVSDKSRHLGHRGAEGEFDDKKYRKVTKREANIVKAARKIAGKGLVPATEEAYGLQEKNWIAGAIKHPGALTRAAKRAHETNDEYEQEHKHDKGKAGKRARLALTLKHMHEGKSYRADKDADNDYDSKKEKKNFLKKPSFQKKNKEVSEPVNNENT